MGHFLSRSVGLLLRPGLHRDLAILREAGSVGLNRSQGEGQLAEEFGWVGAQLQTLVVLSLLARGPRFSVLRWKCGSCRVMLYRLLSRRGAKGTANSRCALRSTCRFYATV